MLLSSLLPVVLSKVLLFLSCLAGTWWTVDFGFPSLAEQKAWHNVRDLICPVCAVVDGKTFASCPPSLVPRCPHPSSPPCLPVRVQEHCDIANCSIAKSFQELEEGSRRVVLANHSETTTQAQD